MYAPGGVLSQWIAGLPATLEYLDLGELDTEHLPHLAPEVASKAVTLPLLRGVSPFVFSRGMLEALPLERRAEMDTVQLHSAVHYSDYFEAAGVSELLRLLPSLRRLQWDTGALEAASLRQVCVAAAGGPLEALYLNLDSCEWGQDECAAIVDALATLESQLIELVVVLDSCTAPVTYIAMSRRLRAALPQATVVVCDSCDPSLGAECFQDVFQRAFLPDLLEKWQTHDQLIQGQKLHNAATYDKATRLQVEAQLEEDLRTNYILRITAG